VVWSKTPEILKMRKLLNGFNTFLDKKPTSDAIHFRDAFSRLLLNVALLNRRRISTLSPALSKIL
jgi:hypothetical protein